MNNRPRVTVAAVIEQDHRFLMVEELDQGSVVLNQPAGHMEFGESPEESAIRETLEETGWHFKPTTLQGIYQSIDTLRERHYIRIAYSGNATRHDLNRKLDDGILRAVWLTYDEILMEKDRLRSPMVLRCIEDYLADQNYPLSLVSTSFPTFETPVPLPIS